MNFKKDSITDKRFAINFTMKYFYSFVISVATNYTETIKLCPLDVHICQFQMYERISFKFSHYQL